LSKTPFQLSPFPASDTPLINPAIVPANVSAKVVAASEVPLMAPAPILSYQG